MEKDEKLHENRWLGRGRRPPNSVPRERNQHGGPHTLPSLLPSQCMRSEETEIPQSNADDSTSVSTLTSVPKTVSTSSSQVTSLQPSAPTANTAAKAMTSSVITGSMPSSTTAKQGTTKGTTVTTVQQTIAPTLAARNEVDNTTSTAPVNGTQLAQVSGTQATQNESVGAPSTKRWPLPPTTSPQKNTSSETSSLHMITLTEPSNVVVTESSPGNKKIQEDTIHYSSVILPVVITLIVITLTVFSLVALYRICHKKTPERQENGTEQAQLDKEGVKLLSVKITTPETGERSSQGKNKTQQCDDSSSHLSNKYV